MSAVRRLATIFLIACFFCAVASAGVDLIEVQQEQHLRRAEGIVRDRTGAPFAGAQLQLIERGSGKIVRSATSHMDGHFVFRGVKSGNYDLRVLARGMNPMLYHLKIDPQGSRQLLTIEMAVAT